MLTMVTVPKPFQGRSGDVQRNAIESWRSLAPDVQIVLVGDEVGVAEAAHAAGVDHVGGVARNERGTPRLDSAFELAAGVAQWPLWCLANADVVLLDDFLPAVRRVRSAFREFVIVGECRDLDVPGGAELGGPAARSHLRRAALDRGRLRGWAALDYFVFPQGLFDPMPPFLIGRACFDNWLVWRARSRRHPVIDATRSVVAVHQSHDYSHVPGGLQEAYYGEDARCNERLAGGRAHIYSLHDASHRLYPKGPPLPYPGSAFRARERARVAGARLEVGLEARRRRREERLRPGERPLRLLAILPHPEPSTTALLDALAAAVDLEPTALYATGSGTDFGNARPRHPHHFPRSIRAAPLERLLGREYPVSWAIANSFYGLRPDCMLIDGLETFAAQAAVAWCVALRVPYLLMVPDGEHRGSIAAVARCAAALLPPEPSPASVVELARAAAQEHAARARPSRRSARS